MLPYLDHNFKRTGDAKIIYYPYGVLSRKGYFVTLEIENQIKCRHMNTWVTYWGIFFVMIFVSLCFIPILLNTRLFPLMLILAMPITMILANYRIGRSICKNLTITKERPTLKERFMSSFYPARRAAIWSIVWITILLAIIIAILIFSKNPAEGILGMVALATLIILFRLLF